MTRTWFIRRISFAHVIWVALALAVLLAVIMNLSELRQAIQTVRQSDLSLLLASFGLLLLYFSNLAEFYRSIFRAGGLRADPFRFLLISSASHFVNLVSKTSGFGGLALYLHEAGREGGSGARVSAAYLTAYVLGYAAYLSVLTTALALLYFSGSLTRAEVFAAGIIFVLVAIIGSVMITGVRSRAQLLRLSLMAAAPFNFVASRLGRAPLLTHDSAAEMTNELYDAVHAVISRPLRYIRPFGHALGIELLSALMLYTVARSLHVNISLEVALAGYAISLLFAILSVTPAGIGFVEVSLTLFLVSFGVPRSEALAVTLLYRFFDFWLPVLLGSLSMITLRTVNGRAIPT